MFQRGVMRTSGDGRRTLSTSSSNPSKKKEDSSSQQPLGHESVKLERFVKAQAGKNHCTPYASALAEIRAGKKMSCWIWYVMPQLKDPARLSMRNEEFQIFNRLEAISFLRHDPLRNNYLRLCTEIYSHLYTPSVAQMLEMEWKREETSINPFSQVDYPGVLKEMKKLLSSVGNPATTRKSPPPPAAAAAFGTRTTSSAGAEMHIGRLMSTMVDAKKAYHSISTFALAAVESIDSYLVISFFANLLDIVVASLHHACGSAAGGRKSAVVAPAAGRRGGQVSTSVGGSVVDSNIQFPKDSQGDGDFPLSKGHPLRELLLYNTETLAKMVVCAGTPSSSSTQQQQAKEEEHNCCSELEAKIVTVAKRIFSKVDPMIWGRWTTELPPISLAKGSALFSQELTVQACLPPPPLLNQEDPLASGATTSTSFHQQSAEDNRGGMAAPGGGRQQQQQQKVVRSNDDDDDKKGVVVVPTTRDASNHQPSTMLTKEEYEVL